MFDSCDRLRFVLYTPPEMVLTPVTLCESW